MRLRNRLADRISDDLRGTRRSWLGDSNELALGATLMIVTVISGQEMAHLVHPLLALTAIGATCLGTIIAGLP